MLKRRRIETRKRSIRKKKKAEVGEQLRVYRASLASNLEKLPAKSAPLELQPMSIADLACRGQIGQWFGRQVGAVVEKGRGRALTGEMGVVKWFVQRQQLNGRPGVNIEEHDL